MTRTDFVSTWTLDEKREDSRQRGDDSSQVSDESQERTSGKPKKVLRLRGGGGQSEDSDSDSNNDFCGISDGDSLCDEDTNPSMTNASSSDTGTKEATTTQAEGGYMGDDEVYVAQVQKTNESS